MLFTTRFLSVALLLLNAIVAVAQISNRYVIKFLDTGIPDNFENALTTLATTVSATFEFIEEISGLSLAVYMMDDELAGLVAELPLVDYLEIDQPVTLFLPGDPLQVMPQANRETVPFGVNMVRALDVDDSNVGNRKVCIIDSGYDLGHEDLPSDSSVVTGSGDIGAGPWSQDGFGHGTHVAGTIAALGGNNRGVTGISRNGALKIHIIRAFDDVGEFWASSLVGEVQRCADAGANIVNLSLGRIGRPLLFERDSYRQLHEDDGLLIVAAAGNENTSQDHYPSNYDAVISVAAIDGNRNRASFSNFHNQVELAAPGVGVPSTLPFNSYSQMDGTSMASPHVSGVAALVWSHFPDKSAQEIRAALTASAEDLGPIGRDDRFGFGLVRADLAFQLLNEDGSVTTQPSTVRPTSINGECVDDPPDWQDSSGNGCDWYEASRRRCWAFGSFSPNPVTLLVANDACCECGGGLKSCQDEPPGWVDSDGDGCDWYELATNRCADFGNGYESGGKTALDACCACLDVTPTSSVGPLAKPVGGESSSNTATAPLVFLAIAGGVAFMPM